LEQRGGDAEFHFAVLAAAIRGFPRGSDGCGIVEIDDEQRLRIKIQ